MLPPVALNVIPLRSSRAHRVAAASAALPLLVLLSSLGEGAPPDTVWPNAKSRANSDPWLVANHDKIKLMKPRLLVLNFVNGLSHDDAARKVDDVRFALKEATRWHGYKDPKAPPFIEYEVAKHVDLVDDDPKKGAADGNSSLYPRVKDWKEGLNFDYSRLYTEEFTKHYAFADPENKNKKKTILLSLGDLVERGYVHEVWFLAKQGSLGAPWECVETKQTYTADFQPKNEHVQAGNGGDPANSWVGRSLRILFINSERGCGCALESWGHSIEHLATSNAIPYFKKYFVEFAGFDLDKRFGLPWDSLYARGKDPVSYPTPTTLAYTHKGEAKKLEGYSVIGGSVHFPPNARQDYDMDNKDPVEATVESYRLRNAKGGRDASVKWSIEAIKPYEKTAPDCMGRWLVYWYQNFPGLENKAKDDDGQRMKNWWPFLFY